MVAHVRKDQSGAIWTSPVIDWYGDEDGYSRVEMRRDTRTSACGELSMLCLVPSCVVVGPVPEASCRGNSM